ncbi:MAG: hypothetical protein HYS36_07500 [Candidatus Rokubacteria bacterium]|nr:hypothetical protein [Candidatus Rokubacteria bacterium]
MRFSHRFEPGTRLRAWLFQILRNTFLTFYRLREREPALAEVEGFPLEDVARIMDCPVGTVKSRIFRAKERMREYLKDYRREPKARDDVR